MFRIYNKYIFIFLCHTLIFWLIPEASYSQSPIIGNRTVEEWQALVDTTWGEGPSTEIKLQVFDDFWILIDEKYAGFQNLHIDWDSLKNVYRPEVEAGVSRGRFFAIICQLTFALKDWHTIFADSGISENHPDPGIPLLIPDGYWDNSHFGAGLSPLPDSSLLVYSVVDNHPLGLQIGDVVLGYEGIPWKTLYKQLLSEAQLPVASHYKSNLEQRTRGTSELSDKHMWLTSAGMNWHLFDYIDILKYGSDDTLHQSTHGLHNQNMELYVSGQIPIPGVVMPDLKNGIPVSWGVVEGTNTGYVYISSTESDWEISVRNTITEAFQTLTTDNQTKGLIIDIRLNEGGSTTFMNEAIKMLFNSNQDVYALDKREDPADHFAMVYDWETPYVGDSHIFDRPIAVLTGPAACSNGDIIALILKNHPMSRLFGLPTNGAFGAAKTESITNTEDWELDITTNNGYRKSEPGVYLNHIGLNVDEEIWFTQEDVIKGEDTVVKRALEWMRNLAYAHDVSVNKSYAKPGIDTVMVTAQVENPNQHELSVETVVRNADSTITDNLNMFDDGLHGDGLADDNVWGNFYLPTPDKEQFYQVSVTTNDLTAETSRTLPNVTWFTTIGPLTYDGFSPFLIPDSIPNPGDILSFKIHLKNEGQVSSAEDIEARLSSNVFGITIHNSYSSYGNINAGNKKESGQGYSIEISSDIDQDTTIYLPISISSEGYHFWNDSMEVSIVTDISQEDQPIPKTCALKQNYPNPFNPKTMIDYQLPKTNDVELSIYNILGQKVVTLVLKKQNAGYHQVEWDASRFSSGIYYYRIEAGEFHQVKKMVLIK